VILKWGNRAKRQWARAAAVLGLAVWATAGLGAQEPQSEFVKASQVPTEVLPAAPLVLIAYAFVWVALIGYVFALWRRLGRVERELAQVSSRLEARRRP
jgi:CcmD family protein